MLIFTRNIPFWSLGEQYDTNYDIRDRARMMKAILFDENMAALRDRASDIFLCSKPAPKFQDIAGKKSSGECDVGREASESRSLSAQLGRGPLLDLSYAETRTSSAAGYRSPVSSFLSFLA